MWTAFFLAIAQWVMAIYYDVSGQPIGPIFKRQESKKINSNFLPIDSPETSVRNYRYLLLNSPEERSSHIWLKSVDWSVFHFCLNSGNIRDTLWKPTFTCHERVSHVTHCIIVGADVLWFVVVRNKAGENVLCKAAHRISKHLVCSSLSLLATCLCNFFDRSIYSPISLHIWSSYRMCKQQIAWISFWRYRVWFLASTQTILIHNFRDFSFSKRIVINIPETTAPSPPLFSFNRTADSLIILNRAVHTFLVGVWQ